MKKTFLIPIIILIILILTYFLFLMSTSSIIKTVERVYCGEIKADDDSPLTRYDLSRFYPDMEYADMRITPLFVIHNGRHGYMYVLYSCEYLDSEKKVLNKSDFVFSKWEIEKKEGEWSVISIEENP